MDKTIEYLKDIVKRHDLKHKSREHEYLFKRHLFSFYCYEVLELTFEKIGKLIGRDHGTIINARNKAQAMIETSDHKFHILTRELQNDLEFCPFPEHEKKRNSIVTAINRVFECRDMQDVEALKAFINENVDPEYLK